MTTTPETIAKDLAAFLESATRTDRERFMTALCIEASSGCPHGALLLTLAMADATANAAEGASIAAQAEVEECEDRFANAPRASANDHRPDGDDERDDARNDLQLARSTRRLADRTQKRAELIARKIRNEVPE